MSDEITKEEDATTSEETQTEPQGSGEIDWKAMARKWENIAKAAKADVADAAKWREFEQNQKSEYEKLSDELARTKAEASEAQARLLKLDVAARKGIPTDALDLLDGSTQEELEAKADKLLSLIADQSKNKVKPDVNQGKPSTGGITVADQFASAIGDLL
jgi:hypothetical protein